MNQYTRRKLMKGTGGAVLTASLTGCSFFKGPDQDGDRLKQDIPSSPVEVVSIEFQSGPGSSYGEEAINTLKLLAEDINNNGGILGKRKINLSFIDEGAGPDAVSNQVRERISKNNVDVFLGAIADSTTIPLIEIIKKNNQLHVAAGGTISVYNDIVSTPEEERPPYFALASLGSVDAIQSAIYIRDNLSDVNSIGILNQDYAWGHQSSELFKKGVQRISSNIEVQTIFFPPYQGADLTSQISQLNEADPDLVWSTGVAADLITVIKQGSAQGLFDDREAMFPLAMHVLDEMGSNMPEDVLVSGRGAAVFTHMANYPAHRQFIDTYLDRFGQHPGNQSYAAYRELNAYIGAVEAFVKATGSWPDPEQTAAVLEGSRVWSLPGFAVPIMDHQARLPGFVGRLRSTNDFDFPVPQEDIQIMSPHTVHPFKGYTTNKWMDTVEM